ncbi:olfactory receptor 10AG1-like [Pelobates fuscus]|uniref:olfactory receptor 10AG1-like n=1 Tax=Pelobates fuscus TaxID=191477 RepID=UPI002FE4DF6F
MQHINITTVILLGFQNLHNLNIVFFFIILTIYCLTIFGNLLIILLSTCKSGLHSPMYIFLTQLSLSDILLTTDIIPNMLHVLLNKRGTMYFSACIIQFYFFGVSETSECLLLTVMAYDRYLAICKPLQYNVLMNHASCLKLLIMSWSLSFTLMLIETINIYKLYFCGPHIIDHFFCDFYPLLELSCSDVSRVKTEVTILCIPVIICPFMIIIVSYIYIIFTILKIKSINGRQKAFSTCSSHLTVVSIFYGALIGIYALPTGESTRKVSSLLYTIVIPFLNPIIYSLRNKDIKKAILFLNAHHIKKIYVTINSG